MDFAIVTPWHSAEQRDAFMAAWQVKADAQKYLILQHDRDREGCAVTKNKGIDAAIARGAQVVIVLDDDCFPTVEAPSLLDLAAWHVRALEPQPVELFEVVTDPPSRGTPYFGTRCLMPVAASMGFWTMIGDYCAVRGLAHANGPMRHRRTTVFGRYFPLCGMNLAFRPSTWFPWFRFIDVPRFDDIWMGWLWQREAYRRGCCFNLAGPLVHHARQSDIWRNLREESVHLEANEALWQAIATDPICTYDHLRGLLPC